MPSAQPTLGYTLLYLSIIVLIPLSAVFIKTARFLVSPSSGTW